MGILNNDIFEQLIRVKDKYDFNLFRIDNPTTGFDCFMWRGIDFLNQHEHLLKVRKQITTDIMDASITKVCTAHHYAHIKKSIIKHIADGLYRTRWKTQYGIGLGTWIEPDQLYVTLEVRMSGVWQPIIQIGLKRIETYDIPF